MTGRIKLCIALLLLAAALFLAVPSAGAHDEALPRPDTLWQHGFGDPVILLSLLLGGTLYAVAVFRLWQRAGTGRGIGRVQLLAFAAGLLVLLIALQSPLEALAGVLFSAHMVQHLLLVLVAAPLLIWAAPPQLWLWLLPRRWRRPVGRRWPGRSWLHHLAHPALVWSLYLIILWLWHAPRLYEAALRDEAIHALEHATLFGAAALFWWLVIRAGRGGALDRGMALLFVFTTAVHSTFLGVLITFARYPWYTLYQERAAAWGLSALADQQLAGAIMWVPAGLIYLLTALWLFYAWLTTMERRQRSLSR